MTKKVARLRLGPIPYIEKGAGPTLLFLHGAIAMPDAYTDLLELLSQTYRVIAPTHPGHGDALPITNDWKLHMFADIYTEFLSVTSTVPSFIVGHSFGGVLSLLLAHEFPDAGIVVMDPCGLPLPLTVKEYVSFMVAEAAELVKKRPDLDAIKEIVPPTETLIYTIIHHPEDIVWFPEHIPVMDVSENLKNITNHVTIIWGEHDKIVPPSIGEKMAELLSNGRIHIYPDKGHLYPVTEAKWTAGEILKVIAP